MTGTITIRGIHLTRVDGGYQTEISIGKTAFDLLLRSTKALALTFTTDAIALGGAGVYVIFQSPGETYSEIKATVTKIIPALYLGSWSDWLCTINLINRDGNSVLRVNCKLREDQ